MKIEFSSEEVQSIIENYVRENIEVDIRHEIRIESKDYSYRGLSAVVTIEKPVDESKKEA